ncbi:neural cell adhesion molecule L1.2 isoform X1 [Periophthalmus magnuspinnatus]|uniref:neural cell adhesion molecule L1.2 isoform X1 n=1 Tax=Periophthalmus magnuspinnatus TaxID=409849 RepID=UPI002436BAEB|nr:neural cell adhesion molecule L1.2 isoform X1 [Periophthalmus magnuspinnatus]XP_055079260.1 neural cell adhesion molecule L1.2 isoform X1 [Periophthalmus magnuspinnatus]
MPHMQRQQVGSRGQCWSRLPLFLLLLALRDQPIRAAIHIPSTYRISDLKEPPTITTQPESVTVFSIEDFVMTCDASGNPAPIFRWTKNGEEFDPGVDPELKVTEKVGSFVFYTLSNTVDSLKNYQGKYVCLASNELGTAVSNEAILSVDAPPTQQKEKKVSLKTDEGNSIVLKCNPPQSAMEPIIHWMDWRLLHIALSERVMHGTDGNLYFAHVTTEDSRNDYTCNVQYLATRTILAKEPITLTVTPSNAVVRRRRPHMMRPTGTHSSYLALRGQSLVLECLVQGYPTPKVKWLRKDGELSESRTTKEMFDRRLRFTNISESDNGEYQCIAENTQGKVVHTYTVSVEAAPYWVKEPLSQLYAPGETVKLDCHADGIPTPTITWTINGTPLSAIDKDPRRVSDDGSLTLKDVNFGDTAIYQCQASNKHGTILTNTNVYVIELDPQILTKDGISYEYVEGQKALFECDTFGSPKPKVTWESESTSSLLSDPRVNLLTNGGLEILNVTHDDEGLYTCSVENTNMSVSAQLEILNRTVVVSPPQDLKVQPGHSATFSCVSSVDPKLSPPFIQWRKNEQKIFESHSDDRYTFEGSDLIISNVQQVDEGKYTCQVITDLDMAEASGTLALYDRPDPPTLLQITNAKERVVTLSWTPGDEHNSPVIEYIVEFEDQEEKSEWEELKRVGGTQQNTRLSLWPYMSYRFRVSAVNEVGKSVPSKPSDICITQADGPDKNPKGVRSDSTDPDTLVITWEEMDKRDFNGPDFRYRVMWRRVVGSGPNWNTNYTTSPPLILYDIGDFSRFEIKVQAVNKVGDGPEPNPIVGYSGEDVPLEAPEVVGVSLVNSTAIRVTWAPVDKNTVRGNLLGYKIHLTWKGSRAHQHSRRSTELEATWVVETGANEEKKVINDLRPYSHYNLAVTVFNSKGEGPPSETLLFNTNEGVPGPPKSLTLDSPSETEITLRWIPPEEPNGVLKGYLLQYHRIVKPDDSPMLVETIDDPTVTHLTLKNLDRHSHYRFYLRGRTSAGEGESIKKDGATTLEGAPPVNISVSVGESSANFSWVAKKRHRSVNFQIEYLNKNDGSKWKKVEKVDSSLPFYQLQGLTPGSHYRMRLSYNNSTFWEDDLDTEGTAMMERQPHFPTEGWFIGLVSAIALLLLILLILCFIKRSKGGKYSVKDKEEGPLDSEARPMKDETFGEYSDLEEKRTASQPSLCEESKLCSQDNLDFNGSSAITTEMNLDESLVSQFSRPSDVPGTDLQTTNNVLNNAVTFLD